MCRQAERAGREAGKVVSRLGRRREAAAGPVASSAAKAVPLLRGHCRQEKEVLRRLCRGEEARPQTQISTQAPPDSRRRWLASQAVSQVRMPLHASQPPGRVSARQVAMQAVRGKDATAIHADRRHSPGSPPEPDNRPHHPTLNRADRAGPCVRQLPDRLQRVQHSARGAARRIVCTAQGYRTILRP